ncbi:branched-chain-amino-acid aminotransferase 5 [Dissoconium aciculare CBS 342.82]|uniref:Branched-chain-amino-acid aminotransferase 5 n=1 Tax=Dissoconium aciculare CBS 342.82 TaxID=1314786 RepID=A0A6J3M5X1_9PEZI|nr:branched-chain-amino-acid aminotransferase 5 [Dissoconium aciculare CBS 342.82]KAF1823451.1 branched-chain-amino-acid aminotransferase 5 [Dissoconium aciculare CBS 342.82]
MSSWPPLPMADIDWSSPKDLFSHQYNGHVQATYRKSTGRWTLLQIVQDPNIRAHGLAAGLNYGQQAFEGLGAFRQTGTPGGISIFRPVYNALRFQYSARVLSLPEVPTEMFIRAIRMAVAVNATYVPPVNSGWSMYCGPLLLATSPTLMPGFPEECTFCVYVFLTALGSQADSAPVKALILDDFDRAATRGTGRAKIGTNYAGVASWSRQASEAGFGITLHLDSVRHENIDQFSTCGFLGVSKLHIDKVTNYTIVVPDSPSAVVGVTSDSILHIAKSWGWNVVKRRIKYTELNNFSEVIGTGTAVGLIQIRSITRRWSDDLPRWSSILRPAR